MGSIWAWPGRGPGVPLLPHSVGNCLRRWRTVSSGWSFHGRPPILTVPTLSTSQVARWVSLHGRESADDGAAAPKGELHVRLDRRAVLRW
jgi:hypothetical protein